jgi:membrane protein DedA with SNARE-associated domain
MVIDAIIDSAEEALTSPWGLLAVFALAAVDGFFPVVPSESLVITAGVLAVSGDASLPLVIVAAAVGAFTGDHVSYAIGRAAGDRLGQRSKSGSRKRAALDWAGSALAARGGSVIVVCRYIPGARTGVTLTAGAVRYPLRSFSLFDGIAALFWATYAALVGYVGGAAFEDDPIKGVALGLAVAFTLAGASELVRYARRRRRTPGSTRPDAGTGLALGDRRQY